MKNISLFALLLALVTTSGMVLAKSDMRKSKQTRSEQIAEQDEQWVEGKGQVSDESSVWYTGTEGKRGYRRGGNCSKGNCSTPVRDEDGCKTVTKAPCGKPPVCRKMVPVEACAEKHKHVTYSYTCPVGYSEVTK